MMKLEYADKSRESLEVVDAVFARDYNESLIHQVVVGYFAGARAGTKAQRSRGQVRGGGKKPWRQKGTGRARAGSIRNPLWRGGGVIHAARPRNHAVKVNRKMYRAAMAGIFSELLRQGRLHAFSIPEIEKPKTSDLMHYLGSLGYKDVLIVTAEVNEILTLSSRNIPAVDVCAVSELNPVSLLAFEKVLITAEALKRVEEWLA